MITPAIKKQTSGCCSISLYPYILWYFKLGIMEKKKEKWKGNLMSAA